MNFAKARRSQGWILALATIVGLSFGGYTFVQRAISSHVYLSNCGIVDYKPNMLFKICADGGVGVSSIKWESWDKSGASGAAIYTINNCKPTCVAGTKKSVAVDVTLTGSNPLHIFRNKSVLVHVVVKSKDGKPLPFNKSDTDSWDLSEY